MRMPFQTSIHIEVYDKDGKLLKVIDDHNAETIWAKLHTPSTIYLDLITQPFSSLLPADLSEINKTMFNYVDDLRSGELWVQFTNDSTNKQYSANFNWTNKSPDETVYLYGLMSATGDGHLYTIFDLSSHQVEIPPNSVVVGRYLINYDNVTPSIPTESIKETTISENEILGGFMTKTTPDMRSYKYTRVFQKTSDYLGVDVNDTDINSVITVSFDSTDQFKRAWGEVAVGQLVYKFLSSGNPGAAQAVRWIDYYRASQRARVVSGNVFYHIRSYLYPIVNSSNQCDRFFGYTDALSLGIREDAKEVYPWKMNFMPCSCISTGFGNTDWEYNDKGIYVSKWISMAPRYIYKDFQNYTLQDVMYLYWEDNPHFTVFAYIYDPSKVSWTLYVNGTAYEGVVSTLNDRNRRIDFDLTGLSAGEGIVVLQANNAFWINMVNNGTDSIYVMSPRFVYATDKMYGYAIPFAGFLNNKSSAISSNYVSAGLASVNGEIKDLNFELSEDDISNLDVVSNLPIDQIVNNTDHQYWVWVKETEKDKLAGQIGVYNRAKIFTMWGRAGWDHTNTHTAPVYVTDNNIITFRPTNIDEVNELSDYLGLEGLLEDTFSLQYNDHIKVNAANKEITFKDDKSLKVLVDSTKSYIVKEQGQDGYNVRIPESLVDYAEGTSSIAIKEGSDYQSLVSNYDPFGDNSGVALYQFDGDANDTSGNYNGTLNGEFSWLQGKFNECCHPASSVSNYISIPTITADNWTITAWIMRDVDFDYYIPIIGYNYQDTFNSDNYDWFFGFHNNNISIVMTDLYPTEKGNWYFVSLVYKGNSVFDLYVNSIFIKSVTISRPNENQINQIGGFTGFKTDYVRPGYFDQLRIFNRILTQEEIRYLCKESKPNTINTVTTYDFETVISTQETMHWLTVNYSADSVFSAGEYLSTSISDGNGAIVTDALETWTKYETYNIPDSDDTIVKDESAGTDVVVDSQAMGTNYPNVEYVSAQTNITLLNNNISFLEDQNFRFIIKAPIKKNVSPVFTVPKAFEYNGETYYVDLTTVLLTDGMHIFPVKQALIDDLDVLYELRKTHYIFTFDPTLVSDKSIDMILAVYFKADKKSNILPYDIHFMTGYQGPRDFKHTPKFLLSLKANTGNGDLYSEYDGIIPTNMKGWSVWTNNNSVSMVDENTFEFNGSNYIKSHTDIASFIHLDVNEPFFLSFDVTIDKLPEDYAVLWVVYRTDTNAGIRLCIDNYGQLFLESASNFTDSTKINRDFNAWTLQTGQKYKIELQFEYEKMRLFVNGRQAVYTARPKYFPGYTYNANNFINIGCDYDSNSHYFTGRIANLFMLNSNIWFHEHKIVEDLDNPETNIIYNENEAVIRVNLPFAIDNKIDVLDEDGNHVDFCILDDNGFDLQDDTYGNLLYIKLPQLRWDVNNISYISVHRTSVNAYPVLGLLNAVNGLNLDRLGVAGYEDLNVWAPSNLKPTQLITNERDDSYAIQTHILTDPQINFWNKKTGFYNKYMYIKRNTHRVFRIISSASNNNTFADTFFPFYAKTKDIKDMASRLLNWDGKYYITDYKFYSPNTAAKIVFEYKIQGNVFDIFSTGSVNMSKQYIQFETASESTTNRFVFNDDTQFNNTYTIKDIPLVYSTLLQYDAPDNAIWTDMHTNGYAKLRLFNFAKQIANMELIADTNRLIAIDSNEASLDRPLVALKNGWFLNNKSTLNANTYVVSAFEFKSGCYVNSLGTHPLCNTNLPVAFWIQTVNRSRYATNSFNFMLIKNPEFISLIKNKAITLQATEMAWVADSYTTLAPSGTEISSAPTNTLVIYKHKIGQFDGYLTDDDLPEQYGTLVYNDEHNKFLSDKTLFTINNFNVFDTVDYNFSKSMNRVPYVIPHLFNSYPLVKLLYAAKEYKRMLYDNFEGYIKYPSNFSDMVIHTEGEIPYDACLTDVRVLPLINTDYNVLWDPNKIQADKINSFGKFAVIGASTTDNIHVLPIIKVIDNTTNSEKVFAINSYHEPEDITDKLYNDLDNENKRYWMDKWYMHNVMTFEFFDSLLVVYNTSDYQFQYGWIIYTNNGIQSYDFATIKAISIMPDFNDETLYQQVNYAWYIEDLDEYTTDINMLPDLGTYTVKVYNPSEDAITDTQVRISLEDISVENFNNGIVAYLNGQSIPTIYEKELQKLTNNFGEATKDYIWVKIPNINGKQTITLELRDESNPYTPEDVFDYYFDFDSFDDSNWEKIVYGTTITPLSAWEEDDLTERYSVWQDSYGDYRYVWANALEQIRIEDGALVFNSQYPVVLRSKFEFDTTKRWEIGYEADNETFFDLYLTTDEIKIQEEEVPFIYYDSTKTYYLLAPTIGDINEFKLYYNEISRYANIDKIFRDRLKYDYLGYAPEDAAFAYADNNGCPYTYEIIQSDYGLRISDMGRNNCNVDLNVYQHVRLGYSQINIVKEIYVYAGNNWHYLTLEDIGSIPLSNGQTFTIINASLRYQDMNYAGLKKIYNDYFNESKNGYITNSGISLQGILQTKSTFAHIIKWDVHDGSAVLAYKVLSALASPFYYTATTQDNILRINNMFGALNRRDVITYLGFAEQISKPLKITYITYTEPITYVKLNMATNYSSVVNTFVCTDEIQSNSLIKEIMVDESIDAVMFRPKHAGTIALDVYYDSDDDVDLFDLQTPVDPSWSDANVEERYRWYYYTHTLPDNYLVLTDIPNAFYSYFRLNKLNQIDITHDGNYSFYGLFSLANSIYTPYWTDVWGDVTMHYNINGVLVPGHEKVFANAVYLTTNTHSCDIVDPNIHVRGIDTSNLFVGLPKVPNQFTEHLGYKATNSFVPQKIINVSDEEAGSYNIDGYTFNKKRTILIEVGADTTVIDSTEQIWATIPYKLFNTNKIRIVETSYKPASALPHYPNNTPTLITIQQETEKIRWTAASLLDLYHNWLVKEYETSLETTIPNGVYLNFVAKTGSNKRARLYFIRGRAKQDLFVITAKKINLVLDNMHSTWYLFKTDSQQPPTDITTKVNNWKQLNVNSIDDKLCIHKTTKNILRTATPYVYIEGDTKIDRDLGTYTYAVSMSFSGEMDFKYDIDDIGYVEIDGVKIIQASSNGTYYGRYVFNGISGMIVYGKDTCCGGHMRLYFKIPGIMTDYELFSYDNLSRYGFSTG